MGLSIRPYAVDLKIIEKVFSSGKSTMKDDILNQFSDIISDMSAWSNSDMEIEKALDDIILGKIDENEGEIYALSTELLCRFLGTPLSNKYWDDVSMNWLMDVNLEAKMPIKKLPLPLNFPYVLSIANSEIDIFIKTMESLDVEEPEAIQEFKEWFVYLTINKKDLVLFFY